VDRVSSMKPRRLVKSIKKAWDDIPTSTLENLVGSMKKRCMEVYRLKGLKTKP
ncbi:hypothetical protein L914_21745, partial [Phytophthora nicotianae]